VNDSQIDGRVRNEGYPGAQTKTPARCGVLYTGGKCSPLWKYSLLWKCPLREYTTLTYRLYKFFVAGENEVIEIFAQHTKPLGDVLEYARAQVETG
jgi:hypothetical protein